MRRRHPFPSQSGFTLFELLVVIVIIGVISTFGIPNFLRLLQRSKLVGMAQETSILMKLARSEAISQNRQTVVRLDPATGSVMAFVDVHGPNITDPSDGIFNPIAGQPYRTTDYEMGRYPLPSNITFGGPAADPDAVLDFTIVGAERVAIFLPDGSVDQTGAFRVGDPYLNYLEILAAPQATGRIRIRKWDLDDNDWFTRNERDEPWDWYG